ncbi:hypothetical protein ANMWB30_37060 [Arthrobacter sp. MWB30]|nr:hypothetical protein ANMWB30_37060 [Arthrobacter sp. MWB30]
MPPSKGRWRLSPRGSLRAQFDDGDRTAVDLNEDDGGSYAPAVVRRSACCIALLARRSAFMLGMLAQAVP